VDGCSGFGPTHLSGCSSEASFLEASRAAQWAATLLRATYFAVSSEIEESMNASTDIVIVEELRSLGHVRPFHGSHFQRGFNGVDPVVPHMFVSTIGTRTRPMSLVFTVCVKSMSPESIACYSKPI